MDPARAARFVVEVAGFLFRQKYPFADFSKLNERVAERSLLTDECIAECKKHFVGEWIAPETGDEALDLFAAGYACHSGQNIGFASAPNSKGYHSLQGRWNHDMASVGYDISKEVWSVSVVAVVNSWGDFNQQPVGKLSERDWPVKPGYIWARLEDWVDFFVGTRSIFFYADVKGAPAKQLPDWGAQDYL
jgi:hypothetical protein